MSINRFVTAALACGAILGVSAASAQGGAGDRATGSGTAAGSEKRPTSGTGDETGPAGKPTKAGGTDSGSSDTNK